MNITNYPDETDSLRASLTPLKQGQAALPMALFLGLCVSFASPIMVAQAAAPSEPATVSSLPLLDENAVAEDDPDDNLVPLDTEGPAQETANSQATTTSSVPRTEDL